MSIKEQYINEIEILHNQIVKAVSDGDRELLEESVNELCCYTASNKTMNFKFDVTAGLYGKEYDELDDEEVALQIEMTMTIKENGEIELGDSLFDCCGYFELNKEDVECYKTIATKNTFREDLEEGIIDEYIAHPDLGCYFFREMSMPDKLYFINKNLNLDIRFPVEIQLVEDVDRGKSFTVGKIIYEEHTNFLTESLMVQLIKNRIKAVNTHLNTSNISIDFSKAPTSPKFDKGVWLIDTSRELMPEGDLKFSKLETKRKGVYQHLIHSKKQRQELRELGAWWINYDDISNIVDEDLDNNQVKSMQLYKFPSYNYFSESDIKKLDFDLEFLQMIFSDIHED